MNDSLSAIVLLPQFNSLETRKIIREMATENGGVISLMDVLDPITNRVAHSEEDKLDRDFDSVVLELLRRTCPKLVFICKDLVDVHDFTKDNGVPDVSVVTSKKTGEIVYFLKGGRGIAATLDYTESLKKFESGISISSPVDWM
jgi:hypothetical protein